LVEDFEVRLGFEGVDYATKGMPKRDGVLFYNRHKVILTL